MVSTTNSISNNISYVEGLDASASSLSSLFFMFPGGHQNNRRYQETIMGKMKSFYYEGQQDYSSSILEDFQEKFALEIEELEERLALKEEVIKYLREQIIVLESKIEDSIIEHGQKKYA